MPIKKLSFCLLVVAFCVAGFTAPSWAINNAEKNYYKQYIDYCLNTGGAREICDCTYNTAKTSLLPAEIGLVAYNLRGGAPADPQKLQKINEAALSCSKEAEEKAAAQKSAEPITPPQPTSIPPLNVPPPPPPPGIAPDAAQTEAKVEKKSETIDSSEQDFLSEIKQKKMPAPPIVGDNNDEESPEKPSKKKVKKESPAPIAKKQYFGQYNSQYFEAAASGNLKAIYAITPYLEKVDIQNETGDTPLMVAVKYGQESVVKYLLSQKADINAQNYKKQTALHIASFMRRPDLVDFLLKNKAEINVAYAGGYTPLMLAVAAQDAVTIKMLISNGAENSMLDNGNTLMHLAALTNNPNIIELILTAGVPLEVGNLSGQTPLMVAAQANLVPAVIKLLETGADLNAVDNSGRNAYQIAYASGARDAVNAILTFVQTRR